MKTKDCVIGHIYNKVKLNELFYTEGNRRLKALVECVYCGKIKIIHASILSSAKFTSCRCQNIKHGMSDSLIYGVYHNMKDRCLNPKCELYDRYGGRGISICDEWQVEDGFIAFYDWAINNGYKKGLSLDRVDNDGNYEPNNCQWITVGENTAKANTHNVRRRANKGSYYAYSPEGLYYEFNNANKFSKEHNLHAGCVRSVANKLKKSYKGWTFGFISEKYN